MDSDPQELIRTLDTHLSDYQIILLALDIILKYTSEDDYLHLKRLSDEGKLSPLVGENSLRVVQKAREI